MIEQARSSRARPAAAEVPFLRSGLLRWYRRNRRDLPWRRTSDPYAIWVSEVMLQQTQVTTVLPYYERFLERFPNVSSLARAAEEQVLGQWSGLGYYRRARSLHAGARAVMERHGGRVPNDPESLLQLPGVGRYTAGAIASIAFGLPEPVLDGNVRRVLSRLFALRSPREPWLWELASQFAQGSAPGEANQALMELGALICKPKGPRCPACPLRRRCKARAAGRQEAYPSPRPRQPTERLTVAVAWIPRGRKVLIERPTDGSPLRGVWDLPALEHPRGGDAAGMLGLALARRHEIEVTVGAGVAGATHGIMNRRLRLNAYRCRLLRGRIAGKSSVRWLDVRRIDEIPVSGATRKVLRLLPA